jgi:hypothetical protein
MVKVWRYTLPSTREPVYDSWSIVFVDETGCVAIISDWGNWSMRWVTQHTAHTDFRRFLIQCDYDYAARKLGRSEDQSVFDAEATRAAINKHVLEARRDKSLTKAQADKEMRLLDMIEDHHASFDLWLQETKLEEAWNFRVSKRAHGLDHWTRVSFERLKAVIKAELDAEIKPAETSPATA